MKRANASVKINKQYQKYISRILIILALVASAAFLLTSHMWKDCENEQYEGTTGYREDSWVYRKGSEVIDNNLEVPAFFKMEKGETYSISTVLTYDGTNDHSPTCFFFVDHMHCRVLLDGVEIFSYMPDDYVKPDNSKSPGNVYVSANLPNDCAGKELKIEFIPSLDLDIDYQLPNPTFGNYASEIMSIFWSDVAHNLISIIALFLGLCCIFYSSIAMSDSRYREGVFIGIFAVLFGLYNITESDFDFYIISNPYYTYVLDYLTFTLIPIFFLAFLRERLGEKQKKISLLLIVVDILMFFVELILHFTGVMDMREFLPILHFVIFTDFLINLVLIATTKTIKWKNPLMFQLLPMLLGMLLDVMVYYMHWQLGSSDSTFTAIGVIIFLISELIYVWKYSVEIYAESTQSKIYQQMAYVDSLTGIGNRRAYEIEKDTLKNSNKNYNTLTVISADLNNLKITNDEFGHASGDFLIRSAANVLSDLSADYGEVFRIGGDEFIAFLYDIKWEELQKRLDLMNERIDSINSNSNAKLGLAVGVQLYNGDIEATIEEADKCMYADKQMQKQKNFL